MEKMTFTYNEDLNTAYVNMGKLGMVVTETEGEYPNHFVVTNTGIRKAFYSSWDFEQSIENDELQFMFNIAYAYFKLQRTRSEKAKAENAEIDLETT